MDRSRLHNLFPSMSRAYSTSKGTAHVSALSPHLPPKPNKWVAIKKKKKKKALQGKCNNEHRYSKSFSIFFISLIKCPNVLEANVSYKWKMNGRNNYRNISSIKISKFCPGVTLTRAKQRYLLYCALPMECLLCGWPLRPMLSWSAWPSGLTRSWPGHIWFWQVHLSH